MLSNMQKTHIQKQKKTAFYIQTREHIITTPSAETVHFMYKMVVNVKFYIK